MSLPKQSENKLRGPRRRIVPDIGQRFAGVLFFRLFRDSPHFKPRLDLIPRLGAVLCFFPFGIVLESRRRRDDRHACPFRRQILAGFLGIFCAGFVSIGNDDHASPIQQPIPGTNDPAAGFVATGQISQLRQIVRVLFPFREENEVARMRGNQVFMVQRHGKTFRLAFCPLARVIIGAGIGVVHNGIARTEIFRLVSKIQRPKPARFVPVFIHGGNGRGCFPHWELPVAFDGAWRGRAAIISGRLCKAVQGRRRDPARRLNPVPRLKTVPGIVPPRCFLAPRIKGVEIAASRFIGHWDLYPLFPRAIRGQGIKGGIGVRVLHRHQNTSADAVGCSCVWGPYRIVRTLAGAIRAEPCGVSLIFCKRPSFIMRLNSARFSVQVPVIPSSAYISDSTSSELLSNNSR